MLENIQDNEKEVVVVPNQSLTDLTDDIIASAERRIGNVEKILKLSLQITNNNDWVDQQGKPYLMASGAEKIARLFGVCWSILRSEKVNSNDEKGQFYFYQVTGVFKIRQDSVEAVGTCSSKDQLFGRVGGELKPLSEVDETNIMKAAYTNCVVNGITRLLGLRNLTWETIKAMGIDASKVASVKYASGSRNGGLISEAQQKRLFAILMTGSLTNETSELRKTEFKKILAKTYGLISTKDIPRDNYDVICEKAKEISEKSFVNSTIS